MGADFLPYHFFKFTGFPEIFRQCLPSISEIFGPLLDLISLEITSWRGSYYRRGSFPGRGFLLSRGFLTSSTSTWESSSSEEIVTRHPR